MHQSRLDPIRDRLTPAQLVHRATRIAKRRTDVGNRIVGRDMHAHRTRGHFVQFIHRPSPEGVPTAFGAIYVGPVVRRKWVPALLALATVIGTRFRKQKRI
jgi:hypothetical protein